MKRDYIPGGNSDFYGFQQFLTDQVTTNQAAWGIPAAMATELTGQNATYNALYAAITNRQTRTPQQVVAHSQGRQVYTTFLRQLVQGYLVNNPVISVDEKVAMGLNPRLGRGSRPQITVMPVPMLSALGGGMVRFEFRVPGDSNRASMHPDSNGVELRVRFSRGFIPVPPAPPTPPMPPIPPTPPLPVEASSEPMVPVGKGVQETHIVLRTRAIFIEEVGQQGSTLHLQARYVNISEPKKSGPWCNEVTLVIS